MIAYTLPIARLCLAIVFLYSGVDKLRHWRSSIEEIRSDGLPWPATFAAATVFTELVGGFLAPRRASSPRLKWADFRPCHSDDRCAYRSAEQGVVAGQIDRSSLI
jgi:hypothetical protein